MSITGVTNALTLFHFSHVNTDTVDADTQKPLRHTHKHLAQSSLLTHLIVCFGRGQAWLMLQDLEIYGTKRFRENL